MYYLDNNYWASGFGGLHWTGLDWTGLDWTGLDWTGLDWNGLEWKLTLRYRRLRVKYTHAFGMEVKLEPKEGTEERYGVISVSKLYAFFLHTGFDDLSTNLESFFFSPHFFCFINSIGYIILFHTQISFHTNFFFAMYVYVRTYIFTVHVKFNASMCA